MNKDNIPVEQMDCAETVEGDEERLSSSSAPEVTTPPQLPGITEVVPVISSDEEPNATDATIATDLDPLIDAATADIDKLCLEEDDIQVPIPFQLVSDEPTVHVFSPSLEKYFAGERSMDSLSVLNIETVLIQWKMMLYDAEKNGDTHTFENLGLADEIVRRIKVQEPDWELLEPKERYFTRYWINLLRILKAIGSHVEVLMVEMAPTTYPGVHSLEESELQEKTLYYDIWQGLPNVKAIRLSGMWPTGLSGFRYIVECPKLPKLEYVDVDVHTEHFALDGIASLSFYTFRQTKFLSVDENIIQKLIKMFKQRKFQSDVFLNITELQIQQLYKKGLKVMSPVLYQMFGSVKKLLFKEMIMSPPRGLIKFFNTFITNTGLEYLLLDTSVNGIPDADNSVALEPIKLVHMQWSVVTGNKLRMLECFKNAAKEIKIDLAGTEEKCKILDATARDLLGLLSTDSSQQQELQQHPGLDADGNQIDPTLPSPPQPTLTICQWVEYEDYKN